MYKWKIKSQLIPFPKYLHDNSAQFGSCVFIGITCPESNVNSTSDPKVLFDGLHLNGHSVGFHP